MTATSSVLDHETNALGALTAFHVNNDRPQSLTWALTIALASFQAAVKEQT